ncbi:MAG: (2Fe-2S) ferredoxin domain-containing protein [Clostridiales bacterium]|jgi:NADP-reducing hydrogenase subunit HndB|nr:(2Fe-2S) ferredoxin domain-containing protein [Clostridiales bacterium]
MSKIKSLDELRKIREKVSDNTEVRITGESADRTIIAVGMATCGIAAGARETMSALLSEIEAKNVKNISVIATGCLGYCYAEPLVEIRPPHDAPIVRYANVGAELAKEIIDKHICEGTFIEDAIFNRGGSN